MDGSQGLAPDVKRRRFTGEDVQAMLDAGVLMHREPYELIWGELVNGSTGKIKRCKFTAADVQTMLDIGVLRDGEHVELIWGELVETSPQGPLHWDLTHLLTRWLIKNLPDDLSAAGQGPLRLSADQEPEPEIFVFPATLSVNAVRGPDALLVIEVAHSTLRYDLDVKGPIYAEHRVREYWVIDVENRQTLVHRIKPDGAYGAPEAIPFDAPLTNPTDRPLVIADLAPKS